MDRGIFYGAKGSGSAFSWQSYWKQRYPSDLTDVINSGLEVELQWINHRTGYFLISIERSTDGINYSELDQIASTLSSYVDTYTSISDYYYRIRYTKSNHYSEYSNIIHILASDLYSKFWEDHYLDTLTAIAGPASGQVTLNWDKHGFDDYTGIKVYLSTNGVDFSLNKTITSIVITTTVEGLTNGIKYYFKVAPYFDSNIGDDSNVIDVTPLDADLLTYISGLSTPLSSTELGYLNTLFTSIKTALGATTANQAIDLGYILSGEGEEVSLRNLASRNYDATKIGSPAYVEYEGYTASSGNLLRTHYKLSSNGVNYTLNSATIIYYSRTGSTTSSGVATGAVMDQAPWYGTKVGAANGQRPICKINGGDLLPAYGINPAKGCYIFSRIDNSHIRISINKSKATYADSSTAIPDVEAAIGGQFQGNAAYFNFDGQLSIIMYLRGLSDAEMDAITDAIEAYMDSHGKGVL